MEGPLSIPPTGRAIRPCARTAEVCGNHRASTQGRLAPKRIVWIAQIMVFQARSGICFLPKSASGDNAIVSAGAASIKRMIAAPKRSAPLFR